MKFAAVFFAALAFAAPVAAQPNPIAQSAIAHVLCLTDRARALTRETPAKSDDEIVDQVFIACKDRKDASRDELVKNGSSLADANIAVDKLEAGLRPSIKDDIAKMKAQFRPR
jgi:hypothetical protein